MSLNYQAAVNISANYSGGPTVNRAKKDFEGLGGTINTLKGALGALGAAFAIKEIAGYAKGIIDLGDHMNDLRQKTGIGIQALSDLKAAAEDGGVNFEALEGSLKKFSKVVGEAEGGSAKASAGFKALGISLKDVNGKFKSSSELIFEISDAFANANDGPAKAAAAMALFGKSGADLIPLLNGGRKSIEGLGIQMSENFVHQSDVFNDQLNQLKRNLTSFGVTIADKTLPYLNQFLNYLGRIRLTGLGILVAPEQAKPYGPDLPPGFQPKKSGKIDVAKLADPKERDAETKAIAKQRVVLAELIEANQLEADRINMSTAAYEKHKIALETTRDAQKATVGFSKENKAAYEAVTKKITEQKQALIDLHEAQKASFSGGAKEAFRDYVESARNVAKQTKDLFTSAFKGMEDSIVAFVQTGKLSFTDLAKSIEADLIRIAFRQAVVFGISSIAGAFAGGAAGGSAAAGGSTAFAANGGVIGPWGHAPLRTYARGGIANRPQLAVYGEGSTPEAFVPLPDGRRIPVNMQGGGSGSGDTSVQINVSIASGGETQQSEEASGQRGKQIGQMITAAVKQVLVNEKRPGGLLA